MSGIRIKKFAKLLCYIIQPSVEKMYNKCGIYGDVCILMFHEITEGDQKVDFSCSVDNLEKIIKWCIDNGYKFGSMDELCDGNTNKQKICYITFDDGYKSLYKHALEVLVRYNVPFCAYVNSEKIGTDNYLSQTELQKLSESRLATIGSHTCMHKMTRYMTKKELIADVMRDKKNIEVIVNKKVNHFAFPYGTLITSSFADSFIVRNLGFSTVAYTFQRPLRKKDMKTPFYLPRIDASRKDILDVMEKIKK